MVHLTIRVTLTLAAAAWTAGALASLQSELTACAQLGDDAARLACYDALAREADPVPTAGASSEMPALPAGQPAEAVPAAVPVVAAPATAAADTVDVDTFGLTPEQAEKAGAQSPEAQQITATVTKVVEFREDRFNYYLDNGQVWQQKFRERGFRVETGDTVSIRRSGFGGYRLVGRRDRTTQVKRLR